MTKQAQAVLSAGPHADVGRTPKKGDKYQCGKCGMAIEVTVDCRCSDPNHVQLQCCGQPMTKA
jgi:hypothetical protein